MSDIGKINNKTFIDLNSKEPKVTEEKFREVSDMYEKHFIKEMMKQMRQTVPEGSLIKKNNAEKIFQDQLDDQYSVEWNKRGGFGLSDMIFQQLMSKFGEQYGLTEKPTRPTGPIELNPKSNVQPLKDPAKTDGSLTYKINSNSDEKMIEVKTPWAGTLQNKKMIEGDKTAYQIKHDNGLESLITTQGAPSEKTRHLSPGDELQAGQALGLADQASPLFWTIKKSVSE